MTRPPLYAYSLVSPFILSLINLSIASVPTLDLDSPQPIAECAEDTFTWGGGLPPYTLSLRDAHSGTSIFSNSSLTDTTFHWVAAVAAGTSLIVELTDTGENGAGPGRLSDSFTVEPGTDSCLSSSSATSSSSSISTTQQTSDSSTSTLSTSTSPSTSSEQPTTSAFSSSSSPPTSPSDSATLATTNTSPSASASASSSSASASGEPAGRTGSASGRTGPDGSSTTPTSPSGSPAPSSPGTGRSPTAGAIAGAAVGSLVAGFVLATGLFCAWRARTRGGAAMFKFGTMLGPRQRRGRLEPYEYPSTDPGRTVRPPASSSPPHNTPFRVDLEGGPHLQHDANFVVARERQRPGKPGYRDSFVLPATQPTTSQRSRADDATVVNVVDRPRRVMDNDMDGAGGDQEIQSGDLVGRGWEFEDPGDLDGFDFSVHSTSTAPPPYSQIA